MASTTFSDESRLNELKEVVASGQSAAQIARTLSGRWGVDITRNAIIGQCARRGIQLGHPQRKMPGPHYATRVARGLPPPPPPKPANAPIQFRALQPDHCRYPHDLAGERVYCGKPKQNGSSYCPEHHARCWVKPKAASDRLADKQVARRRVAA